MKKSELFIVCRTNKITGFSKLKKDAVISLLLKQGIKNVPGSGVVSDETSKKKKTSSTPKVSAPRIDKLSKQLEKSIVCADYKETLSTFKEDVDDETLLNVVKDKVDAFIHKETLSHSDFKRYVDSYGSIKSIVEFLAKTPKAGLGKMTEEQMYQTLATFLYANDTTVYEPLLKKLRKSVLALIKVEKASKEVKPTKTKTVKAKISKKSVEEVEEPSDDDDPESDADADSNDDASDEVVDDDAGDESE